MSEPDKQDEAIGEEMLERAKRRGTDYYSQLQDALSEIKRLTAERFALSVMLKVEREENAKLRRFIAANDY